MSTRINDLCYRCTSPNRVKKTIDRPEEKWLCEACTEIQETDCLPTRDYFEQEFDDYLNNHSKILFAYSGGLDSTVVLALLVDECQKRKIELETFTVETGVKGKMAMQNIATVIKHFGIINHMQIDITKKYQNDRRITAITGQPLTTLEVYRSCLAKNILPCGQICNVILDSSYTRLMEERGYTEMITGGDTPKKNQNGKYSLFWKKESGITIVRGSYAFGLNKQKNKLFIKERNIPWKHPHCGGYDTDCLVPGVFFAEATNGNPKLSIYETIEKFPIVIDYLSERVRFGIYARSEAIKMLKNIDIANLQSYIELHCLLEKSKGGDQ